MGAAKRETPNDLITADQAGSMLGLTGEAVRKWGKKKLIRAWKKGGRFWMFSRSDVMAKKREMNQVVSA